MRTSDKGDVSLHAREQVLILNWRDQWHPEGGGSELYVAQVARRLNAAGNPVTWMTAAYPGAARDEVVDGIRYVRRGGHVTVYLWAALLLLTRRLGRRGHVLEVQNGMPFLARLWTRRPVTVLVHHVHREQWSVVGPLLARVGWFLESRAAVRVNRGLPYVAVSDVTRRELIDLGVDGTDIRLAYNGLPPIPAYDARPRSERPSLVVLSRLVPHKRIEHAIECLPQLAASHPDLTLTVMGDGWWRETLEKATADLGLTDRVRFLGHVDEQTKFEELSSAWLHLMPSVKEGWGLSIMEAASAGVPSVAYADAGGVVEAILDGVTGTLAHDQDDLVGRVRDLLNDEDRLGEMGQKARLRAHEFTWDATTASVAAAMGAA